MATIAYYSVSFLTILSICVGTSIRLNWALLTWSVVFLALTLCAIAIILQFVSDYYLGTTYLNNDNQVAMVQLTWAYFGCIGIGLAVKRFGRGTLVHLSTVLEEIYGGEGMKREGLGEFIAFLVTHLHAHPGGHRGLRPRVLLFRWFGHSLHVPGIHSHNIPTSPSHHLPFVDGRMVLLPALAA